MSRAMPADLEELAPVIGAPSSDGPPAWRSGGAVSSTAPLRANKRAVVFQLEPETLLTALPRAVVSKLRQHGFVLGVVLCLLGISAATLVLLYGREGSFSNSLFSIVIDAGSTGSRVHVFRFDARSLRLLDVAGEPEVFRTTEPGLSSCAQNRSRVPELLQPLLDAAAAAVPAERQPSTPVAVRATAGLRMLPGNQADLLLEDTRQFLGGYKFASAGVEVMGGDDEGAFQWLAVNLLMDAFSPGGKPVVVIDLGGGSVQIAYAVSVPDAATLDAERRKAYVRQLNIPGQEGQAFLYQHSYPGFGLMAARARMLEQANATGASTTNPCILSGAEVQYTYNGRTYLGKGVGEAQACTALVRQMFDLDEPCGQGESAHDQCSFNGVWAGPGWSSGVGDGAPSVAACSFFFDGLRDAGAIAAGLGEVSIAPSFYRRLASEACAAPFAPDMLHMAYPTITPDRARWLCFDLSYLAELLTSGFGFAEGQMLRAVKQITHEGRSYGATWALGVALQHLGGQ